MLALQHVSGCSPPTRSGSNEWQDMSQYKVLPFTAHSHVIHKGTAQAEKQARLLTALQRAHNTTGTLANIGLILP